MRVEVGCLHFNYNLISARLLLSFLPLLVTYINPHPEVKSHLLSTRSPLIHSSQVKMRYSVIAVAVVALFTTNALATPVMVSFIIHCDRLPIIAFC
jgi:hypothetical protein